MAKVTIPLGEWRPDMANLDTQVATDVDGVLPEQISYQPLPDLAAFSNIALPTGPPCGLTAARKADGSWTIYGGSPTKLYRWALGGWTDVSRTTGGAYNVPFSIGQRWRFAQFGPNLIAAGGANDDIQYINVDTGSNFAVLAGAPRATNVATIGDFVVLSGLVPGFTFGGVNTALRQVAWCAINNCFGWSVGLNLCDMNEFADGGLVQQVLGDVNGYVVQDRCIRTMQFLPGDTTYVFQFSKALVDHGGTSKYGSALVGNVLYTVTEAGFFAIAGQQVSAIGQDKVNLWWLANSEQSKRDVVQCISANRPFIIWAFHTAGSSQDYYDRVLIFNWNLQRWAKGSIKAYVWALLGSLGLDLDTDGAETGDPLLDSTAQPLDSFAYVGGRPLVAAFNPDWKLATLDGPPLEALMETVEMHLVPGMRAMVNDVYPLIDAPTTTVSAGTRERLQDLTDWGDAMPLEITGSCAVYSSGRLHRYRIHTTRGDLWSHAMGIIVDPQQDGTVA